MLSLYYPLFVSLQQRVCLVVGGGQVAERKIRTLLPYGPAIRIVAQDLTPWLQNQHQQGLVAHLGTQYHPDQLDDVDLVFATTDDLELNQQVAMNALSRRVWCNMATDPQMGSVMVPAIVERGPLTIAISTAGLSPAVARRIRLTLELQFGPEWGPYLMLLGNIRSAIQQRHLGAEENQRLFRELAELPLLGWLRDGSQEPAIQALHLLCRPWLSDTELAALWKDACAQCFS
jgi:precorrin-2 dehydrogenase / sirohydrochlorin ferrochelatase